MLLGLFGSLGGAFESPKAPGLHTLLSCTVPSYPDRGCIVIVAMHSLPCSSFFTAYSANYSTIGPLPSLGLERHEVVQRGRLLPYH